MRLIFMGSPAFAVPTLDALVAAGHEIAAVYCQPPRPAQRGKKLQPTAVQLRAEELGLPVRSPERLRSEEEQAAFAALGAEAAVVAAYGLLLPQPILDAPSRGCLNVHASLLPRWRGAAPIHRAILAGDEETGVTIMAMEAGLDTGPMLRVGTTPIAAKNVGELTTELGAMGARLMVEELASPSAPRPQPAEGVTLAPKIAKAEARIDWTRAAAFTERQVRAFAPAPGAWFEAGSERVKLLAAELVSGVGAAPGTVLDDMLTIACGSGAIRPTLVQRAGSRPMTPAELLRGFAIPKGTVLS
ncbi:methionyl-tRNA formyltransferase [Sphingomonas astaxanthinifaciens]|uniref:Methionyl-tRNA formyltransferase n=1 Tax=Sphingomonas astaxanthinifaciens DSM 22298 TaxID=1123267 RepID=A0ABQ5Z721_9SPHN|nr:methionyl-tRNA formyltransferase [Sphingomonas astaxanthinifaciens]GLR46387.1 methionyl-tRNA formyltransferase [Sphingomonas astaxanthinifaciens DSM 22298]